MSLVISPKAYNSKVGFGLFCPLHLNVETTGYPFEVAC
jgi:hypothetical protein